MKRITLILILCLSAAGPSFAQNNMAVSPVIVQPYEVQELTQQMLHRDRQNRDEEIAIQGLIEENNELRNQDTLAHQQDEGLQKINQTMLSYRHALYDRDHARITANSKRHWTSRYGDLIALTQEVEGMTGVRGYLESKSDLLAEKYQMLTDLKDEMMALNAQLKGKEIIQQQQYKIQMLVRRLDAMDRKISHFDEIIAQKDRQIARLKDNLATAQSQAFSQKEAIHWLKQVLAVTKNEAEYYKLTSQQDRITVRDKQDQVDLLKSELENKITEIQSGREKQAQADAQSNKMTLMMPGYQTKNDQVQMEGQIADLSARLQEKEAQIVKIKKQMYDLQELTAAKDRDLQAKDLNLFMMQHKMRNEKSNLALASQQAVPIRNQIHLLRTRLKKATLQLKQKDEMLLQMKANADEYAKEFREQSLEFQSLNEQLQNAYEEITRLKKRSTKGETHENSVEGLQAQLKSANLQIKDLQAQLNQLNALPQGDRLREKLKQALDKIDEQGRVINVLVQKLHDAGQSVDLTAYTGKS